MACAHLFYPPPNRAHLFSRREICENLKKNLENRKLMINFVIAKP